MGVEKDQHVTHSFSGSRQLSLDQSLMNLHPQQPNVHGEMGI